MADIAMLVAEEYDRRVKSAKKAASGGSESDERLRILARGLKHKFDEVKSQILCYDWVWEPRTQISVAASHSFFSA